MKYFIDVQSFSLIKCSKSDAVTPSLFLTSWLLCNTSYVAFRRSENTINQIVYNNLATVKMLRKCTVH